MAPSDRLFFAIYWCKEKDQAHIRPKLSHIRPKLSLYSLLAQLLQAVFVQGCPSDFRVSDPGGSSYRGWPMGMCLQGWSLPGRRGPLAVGSSTARGEACAFAAVAATGASRAGSAATTSCTASSA